MRVYVICFALGVWLLQCQAALPGPTEAMLGAGVAIGMVVLARRLPRAARRIVAAAACFTLGIAWASIAATSRLADALAPQWEGRNLAVTGIVARLPRLDEQSVRFVFDVESVEPPAAVVPRHILLSWWGTAAGGRPALSAGERWRLTVRLRRPHGGANPHGFDYEGWLFERGVRATGYVRAKEGAERLSAMVYRPQYLIEAARERVRSRILGALEGRPYAGVIAALAIGDQAAIPPRQWAVFTRTGVNHLMSISGLHVTMVAGLAFAAVFWGWRRSTRLTLRLPARKAAAAAGLLVALTYSLLAGFAVPAQRTLYMLAVSAAALWAGRIEAASTVVAAALVVVLIADPWAVLAPGFWLSFGAVAVILFVTVGRVGRSHWAASFVRVQWAVTVALVPPLVAAFQQVSLVSPFANAIAIPVVSLVVVPLTLLGTILPFDAVLQLAQQIMAWCGDVLAIMSATPVAVWQQHAPPAWTVAAAAAGALWMLLPRGFPQRALGLALFAPLVLTTGPVLDPGEMQLTVLDVGEGLAVVAATRGHTLLYDTGPAFGSGADSGNRTILPFLRAAGIRSLSGMIVSHADSDHSGGAASVLDAMPVQWMMSSLPDMHPLTQHAKHAIRCEAGQHWEWDEVRFEILHPPAAAYDRAGRRDNNRSCVLRIITRAGSVLLPGDIERRAEAALVARTEDALQTDVLIAPHQGSRTSSTLPFLHSVRPQRVIFPVGYRNRFRHPHQDVLERYRTLDIPIYHTDRDGALTLDFDRSGFIHIEPYRAVYRRYWQTALPADPVAAPASFAARPEAPGSER